MMVLPYRAKNPPARFPYVTYGLIAANVAIYACTSDYFLFLQKPAMEALAFSNEHLSLLRMLSAMFLHANLLHLIGNMLFLWIFGQAVEGRLGPVRYLALYLLTGLAGDLLQVVTMGQAQPRMWNLGASGAIMGIAGAYMYMFPFATICVFYQYWYRFGLADWAAQWVILYFLAFDLIDGILYQGWDGVGHFVHLGGAALGFFLPMLLRVARDSEDASTAQAVRVDAHGDYSILAIHELEALIENHPGDMRLLMTFCQKASMRSEVNGPQRCMDVLRRHGDALLAQTDPDALAHLILTLPSAGGPPPTTLLMRLGAKLETTGSYDTAAECYRRIFNDDHNGPDAQTALIRLARLTEQLYADKRNAAALYIELLQRYPNGSQSMYAESALRRLGFERPKVTLPPEPPQEDAPPTPGPWNTPTAAAMEEAAESPLSPLLPRFPGDAGTPPPSQRAPELEPAYNVGETRGMVLRPLGGAVE